MDTKLHDKKRIIREHLPNLSKLKNFKKKTPINISTSKIFTSEEKSRIVVEGQSNPSAIVDICLRERITPDIFYNWSEEIICDNIRTESLSCHHEDDKFRIVLEGMNGEFSVAEICRKEGISQEDFLSWSHEFLDVLNLKLAGTENNRDLSYKKRNQIREIVGLEGLWYFESYLSLNSPKTFVLKKSEELDSLYDIDHIICLNKINDIRHINKFFEQVNHNLQNGSVFIGCLETFSARKERLMVNNLPILNSLYFGFEFLIKRILPKLSFTKRLYFDMTKGKDRLLSKAEGLGRLVCCGFKIMDYKTINGLLYFVVQKEKEPTFDMNPSYGPIYAMPRLGKNGKIINVYKMRTMHPYSEYLQDYVIRAHGYAESGKPASDFRIPTWGKFLRKYWLDELPQLYNFLKGELKLIGIRPVSERYFQDIPREMQKLRLTQKPGCIPPYVSLNRSGNVMSVLQSEKEYLEEKIRNPYTTDTKYFFKALYSIIVKHKRSA